MALLGYAMADDRGNEGEYCLSNEECEESAALKCGFYNDYKDTGRYLKAECVNQEHCDTLTYDLKLGKDFKIFCRLDMYEKCSVINNLCSPGTKCFGPLECLDCDVEEEYPQMCVEKCDYQNDIVPASGPFQGNTYHSIRSGGASMCSDKSVVPDVIEPFDTN